MSQELLDKLELQVKRTVEFISYLKKENRKLNESVKALKSEVRSLKSRLIELERGGAAVGFGDDKIVAELKNRLQKLVDKLELLEISEE